MIFRVIRVRKIHYLRGNELDKKVSDLMQPFVPLGVARQRFVFLGVIEVNVDFGNEISVLECFQKFMDKDIWQLSEQRNIYPNLFFAAHPYLKPRSQARSWMDKCPTDMKTLIRLLILQVLYINLRKACTSPKDKVLGHHTCNK